MPLDLLLTLAGVFASVGLLSALAVSLVLNRYAPERRQLRKLAARAPAVNPLLDVRLTDAPTAAVRKFERLIPKSPKEMSRLRRRLAGAGIHHSHAPVVLAAAEVLLPLLFGISVLLMIGATSLGYWLLAGLAALLGYLAPGFWLDRKTAQRRKQIQNGLPDALDLLIICIEAGSGIDQAIVKASDELYVSYPALAEEMRFITTETRAGKPRLEAFRNFAERTKVDDVRSLVAMLVQTDKFGTSVAQALRTHAETARIKRRQRAEERAAKIGVKLVFPLVLCLFPALYVVILGPAVIEYLTVFRAQIQ